MKQIIFLLGFAIFMMFNVLQINGQIMQQVTGAGIVNWQDQIIKATGIGGPNPNSPISSQRAGAIRAAKMDALRQLLETVQGMQLTSETIVRNAFVENDVIVSKVSGVIKNFKQVDIRYLSDGSVEVDVEVPISGILRNFLFPENFKFKKPEDANFEKTSSNSTEIFTGLIVDARGFDIMPAIAPKIFSEDGNEIYSVAAVSRDCAVQIGFTGYEKDMQKANTNERVKGNPIIVKSIKAAGTNKTDVVISNSDAAKILAAAESMDFIEKCKVMIVLD
jgi:hypothetical protein